MGNKMIHKFSFDDLNIAIDVGSGSLHVIDNLAWEAISLKETGLSLPEIEDKLKFKWPKKDVQSFIREFTGLINNGLLFSKEKENVDTTNEAPVVKALCLHAAHACNLSCRYCFAGQGKFSGDASLLTKEVGFKAIDFLLDQAGERKHVEVDFFGGEPLLNFSVVKEVTEYGEKRAQEKGKNIKFTLTTNGILLKGEIADYFQEKKFSVVLSLDGRKEINDKMRPFNEGRGSFDKVFPNILSFVEERDHREYFVRGTFTRENLDFSKDVEYLAELGFKHISLEPVVCDKSESYALRKEDLPQLLEEYEKLTRLYLKKEEEGNPFTFFHFNIDLAGGPCLSKRIKGCGAGTEYLAVTPEGDLYPCHQFVGKDNFKLGRLGENIDFSIAESFAQANVYTKEHCKSCWAKYYCGGGCHANSYNLNGDIHLIDELGCLLEKKRLECALYIKAKKMVAELENKSNTEGDLFGSAGL